MRRIFTVEDDELVGGGRFEKSLRESLLVTIVFCALDVAAFVLVLETAVDDHLVVELMVVHTVQNVDQSRTSDPRQTVGLRGRDKVRKLQRGSIVDIHDRLQAAGGVAVGLLLRVHDFARVLVHTEGPPHFGGSSHGAGGSPDERTERRTIGTSGVVVEDERLGF